ncbi:MAG: glycosyltransferase [Epsilonproteobacteria bacterium]|nr:glycosyltransferase [Campylobacterota bacterium]
MKYRIEHLQNDNGTIVPSSTLEPTPTKNEIAIIFHVYYIDVWEEVQSYLNNIKTPYDLYVNVPENMPEEDIKKIFALQPQVNLYRSENRGRDVLPFLQIMHIIGLERYKYICKLHTKKTGNSPLGHVWRKLLYFDLIGSDETVKKTVKMFEDDPNICMITGKNTILDSRRYNYGNTKKIDRLIDACGFLFQDEYYFAGGTMFWFRPQLLTPLMKLFENGSLEFEEERGQKDNTIAHAIERFFGILCAIEGKKIAPSPSDYTKLDNETIEETASLVLSQQYHGEDIFTLQQNALQEAAQTNHQLHQRIDELEELADLKRRFKKEVKKYIPQQLWSVLKSIKGVVWTLKNNPTLLKKVIYYIKRGEIKYLLSKIKQKTDNNIQRGKDFTHIIPQHIIKPFVKSDYPLGEKPVDIIIPVYNGYEFLEKLFDSIEAHTTAPYRLIVINDAGDDERVLPYLQKRLQKHPTALLIEHETNQGFVKSVNEAYSKTQNHFVILNTDTEVPSFWLERLMYPIFHQEKIASTTPFTNAGTIASFPNFIVDNPIFEGLDVETIDRSFRNINPEEFYEEIPTGVGFCMGVNKELADTIGFFDEESFGKGYGEENDWCQRAIQKGYKNFLVPNLFVYHKHGGSFDPKEKEKLLAQNIQALTKKHPNYEMDVQKYVAKDPHKTLREILVSIISSKKPPKADIIIDHALGGGANQYAQEHIETLRLASKKVFYITYDYYLGKYTVTYFYKDYNFGFSIDDAEGIKILLEQLDIEEIFVNSLVSYRETETFLAIIKELKDIQHAKLIVPMHDYYPLCPNYTLLQPDGKYCDIPSDTKICEQCLSANDAEWKNFYPADVSIESWRTLWKELFLVTDNIICFSNSSKKIIKKAYPDLDEEKIKVIPHTVKNIPQIQKQEKTVDEPFVIGVLGAINFAKGAGIIKELVALIDKEDLNIQVTVIGEITEMISSKHFKMTGRYKHEELPSIITEEKVDLFLIPSICPETFSYTSEEIMQMDYPLVVFDIGAPAERVSSYEKGHIIKEISAQAVLDKIKTLL